MDHPPHTQKLPTGLAGVLNSPDNRDSAYYSSTDASSRHTSAASCAGAGSAGPPSTSSISSNFPFRSGSSQLFDKTPSPTTNANMLPQPIPSPAVSSMSVASIVSPTSPSSGDLRRLNAERPQSLESAPNSAGLTAASEYDPLARRESVDSRINQGIGDLRLGGGSPYATRNPSTTSLHSAYQAQQQRPSRQAMDALSIHRISNGYQPSADRNPERHTKIVRTAPAITGPATSQIARAAEPTKGQAWAFPEEEIQRLPSVASQSLHESRRSSLADSFASSQFTTESRLPSGQRRLDEAGDYLNSQRLSAASAEYPTTHHHGLQNKQFDDLQSENGSTHGSQPYSRTPELRVSHKLAERKRRTEMKELFEQLRDLMPQERGSKASKWEILTKAITEHQRLDDTARTATQHANALASDLASMKSELLSLRLENQQLRADVSRLQANAMNGAQGQGLSDPYGRGPQPGRPELPPLRSLSNGLLSVSTVQPPLSESMTGLQYDQSRVNGFRQPDRFMS